jgi:hypothetical protein
MADIEKGRLDRPRDEGVITSRIEAEKKEKVAYASLSSSQTKRLFAATFLNTLRNLFDFFSPEGKSLSEKVIEKQTTLETLLGFKKLLERLSKEDLSQDTLFAGELSQHFLKMEEDFAKLQVMERKGSIKVAHFRRTLETFERYPPEVDHHFGYYLLQQAGKDWLPFPFIEILAGLYTEYQEKGSSSTLSQWNMMLDQLITELRGIIPK